MSFSPEEHGCWLEGNFAYGAPIRADVCAAASEIFVVCRRKTQSMLGDGTETANLMEIAASQTSRYLDNLGRRAASANVAALLTSTFSRLLSRRAKRRKRFLFTGRAIETAPASAGWEQDLHRFLFFSKLQCYLSPESVTILWQRLQDWTWEEIAKGLNVEATVAKARFWREIEYAKKKLKIGPAKRRPKAAHPPGRNGAAA